MNPAKPSQREILEQRLRTVLEQHLQRTLDGCRLQTDLKDAFGLDSLASLRLLAAVEKHFGVRFPDHRLTELRSLQTLLEELESQRDNS